jgi:hypothetical protein
MRSCYCAKNLHSWRYWNWRVQEDFRRKQAQGDEAFAFLEGIGWCDPISVATVGKTRDCREGPEWRAQIDTQGPSRNGYTGRTVLVDVWLSYIRAYVHDLRRIGWRFVLSRCGVIYMVRLRAFLTRIPGLWQASSFK